MNPLKGIGAIAAKEARHIRRDRRSMLILFALPAVIVGIFGFVLSFEIENNAVAVLNQDRGALSRKLLHKTEVSRTFRLVEELSATADIHQAFSREDIKMVIVIPPGFSRALTQEGRLDLHLWLDASEPKVAWTMERGMKNITGELLRDLLPPYVPGNLPIRPLPVSTPLADARQTEHLPTVALAQKALVQNTLTQNALTPEPVIHFLYNPTLKKEAMPIPGLIMVIFILVSSIMLSISINKEKEHGTARLLNLTPLGTSSMLLGKTIPYLFISVFHILTVWLLSRHLFGVTVAGSGVHYFVLCVLFALNAMTFGILISSLVTRQLEALIICWLFLFIPNIFLSGFIFPVLNMPAFMRGLAGLLPGTSFIEAYRGIVFRGTGLAENASCLSFLAAEGVVVLGMAILIMKLRHNPR